MAYTHIEPGVEIEISGHIYHEEGDPSVAELVSLPMEELDRMEQGSIDKEQEIFKAMCDLQPQWSQQAKETAASGGQSLPESYAREAHLE